MQSRTTLQSGSHVGGVHVGGAHVGCVRPAAVAMWRLLRPQVGQSRGDARPSWAGGHVCRICLIQCVDVQSVVGLVVVELVAGCVGRVVDRVVIVVPWIT